MLRFLKGVVAGSSVGNKDLPYNIGEPYSTAWGSWIHYKGTSRDDGSSVSIFSLSVTNYNDGHLAAGRNGVKRLRTVRHPNILSFLHSTEAETSDGSATKFTIYVVTEPVMPLSEKISELGLQGTQRDEFFAWGLHQIAKAVSFLNNDCKLVHGNVCVSSVVVTETLDWKLHAFDVLSEFDNNNEVSTAPMLQFEGLIEPQYKPMELTKNDWPSIRKSPHWAIDSWGMGCFIYELFSGLKLLKTEGLRITTYIPKSLLTDYQRLLSSTPSRRLNTSKLIENGEYFQNKLVDTIRFMEILNLKDSVEKDTFFRKLPNLSEQLPRQIVLKKLLPLLSSALEFSSAAAPALTALLKIGSWISPEEFRLKVLPTIVKLFASNDRAIRVCLLQHIDQYGESLSAQIVDEQIYPHVATGFSDTSAFLRELTLKSILALAPKISQRNLSGSLLKHLSKLQVDEEPAIRTNTTILLGNIANYLNEMTRKRVLINAFTVRALKDSFPPARGAGVMALCATISNYDTNEIATRILPNIVLLTVDPDSEVRSKSFEAVDQFLKIMKKSHEGQSGDTVNTSGIGIPSLSGNSGILGWAMSSLASKSNKPSEQTPVASGNYGISLPSQPLSTPSSGLQQRTHSLITLDECTNKTEEEEEEEGWGEIENGIQKKDEKEEDGWDDIEPVHRHGPAPLNKPASSPITAASPISGGRREKKADSSSVNSNNEDDDDLWGAIAAPPPVTRARPLSAAGPDRSAKQPPPRLGAQKRITRA